MNLVIVESPSKAKTIKKFLGPDFQVTASSGHVKDLPAKYLGVDLNDNFKPRYEYIPGKKRFIDSIRKLAQEADQVYIATDPDREGEAIGAHVADIIRKTHPSPLRALFYEITRSSVQKAIANPIKIDQKKVDAQVARRVVDRLVGYKVSPFIWKTVAKGLSAGRVQSVALRLICDREAEIRVFEPREYWSIHGLFSGDQVEPFWAELVSIGGKKVDLPDRKATDTTLGQIGNAAYQLAAVTKKQLKTRPYPPYTTSTLQQDASRKLRFSAKRTMQLAQTLYEGVELPSGELSGLITYMRTDSLRVANEAINAVRHEIEGTFGPDYLPQKPRHYKKKGRSQDAHEAIRPTDASRTPDALKDVLDKPLWKLYDLIWRRFVASQMSSSLAEVTTIDIEGGNALFRAKGQVRLFDGFQKVYPLESENGNQLPKLPDNFKKGYPLSLNELDSKQHFTQPPARYTEATLVKALDELGIGRPSTYATIISTLFDRTYVKQEKRKLHPTDLGETVNKILIELFPDIFEVGFTARMEEQLDDIEGGDSPWVQVVEEFYGPFSISLEHAEEIRGDIKKKVEEVSDQTCEKCGRPMLIKWGRRGKFLACSGFPECKNAQPLDAPEETGQSCPDCGGNLVIKQGRYGRFLGCSNYPKCKHVEPISTGVHCPKPDCKGELVERSSKKGRFWGCSEYPECKTRIYKEPAPVRCDNCGHPFMVHDKAAGDGQKLICPECKHALEPATDSEAA